MNASIWNRLQRATPWGTCSCHRCIAMECPERFSKQTDFAGVPILISTLPSNTFRNPRLILFLQPPKFFKAPMDLLQSVLDIFMNLDQHLFTMIVDYGLWIYLILFLIIFVETGLVIMPFLPGDSLLFAAGTFCAGVVGASGETASLNLWWVLGLLTVAAILGDTLNYYLGKNIGLKILGWKIGEKQLVNPKYIEQTQDFYRKNGPKTIIIARFVPIVRTFAPFVAGIGSMNYSTFLKYNIIGGIIWVFGLTLTGYFFGNMPIVRENFETVVLAIIGISVLPMVWEFISARFLKKDKA